MVMQRGLIVLSVVCVAIALISMLPAVNVAVQTGVEHQSYNAAANIGTRYSHAVAKHGTEGELVSNACRNGNHTDWQTGPGQFIQTCFVQVEVPDKKEEGKMRVVTRVGFRVLVKIDNQLEEITAYVRTELGDNPTWKDILNWANRNGWTKTTLR